MTDTLGLDYTSKEAVKIFADAIRAMPDLARAPFLAGAMALGLMHRPWYVKLGIKLQMVVHGVTAETAWLRFLGQMERRMPGFIIALGEDVAKHVEAGKDLYDPKSAGGWCKSEFETATQLWFVAVQHASMLKAQAAEISEALAV